jgi:RNA polymerase sigma factor (sigma-70 family)
VEHATPEVRAARRRAAVELLDRHGPSFRRTARRLSICADDADDALQRAAEILLTKAPPIAPRRLAAWMHVVTRHEALAVRRARERLLGPPSREGGPDPAALADAQPSPLPEPAEEIERSERVAEARRALAGLSDAQQLALVLQAAGYSYAEIARSCGWTYTKVNRCLAEGRARLRQLGQH